MRFHTIAMNLSLLATVIFAAQVLAQDLPQDCLEAREARSPQAQVDLFTSCLATGLLRGNDKSTTLKQRAIAYMHLGQHPRALEDINQAIKIRPDDADNFYLRGFSYRALNQNQRALEDCTRAINLDSNFAAAYATRAFANKSLGNIDQAKADVRRALEIDPKVKVPTF